MQVVNSGLARISALRGQGCSENFPGKWLQYDSAKDLPSRTGPPVPTVWPALWGCLSLTRKRCLKSCGLCHVPDKERNTEFSRVPGQTLMMPPHSSSSSDIDLNSSQDSGCCSLRNLTLTFSPSMPLEILPAQPYTTFPQNLTFSLRNQS